MCAEQALASFQAEPNIEYLGTLTERIRIAVFMAAAVRHVSPDGLWKGSCASLAQAMFPGEETTTFVAILATRLVHYSLRQSVSLSALSFEVFYFTPQLRRLAGAPLCKDDGIGPRLYAWGA
jgi:hypothetical protein